MELKTNTTNEEGIERVVLQNVHVLAQFKRIDGHATYNVLKRQ
jgi:hypothetical protein